MSYFVRNKAAAVVRTMNHMVKRCRWL